jgi:phage tail tape-measure protein
MIDRRYEDDRLRRRNRSGLGVGAMLGVAAGTGLGLVLPGIAAVTGGLVGAGLGGAVGRWLVRRVSVDEFDPYLSERPYVGAQAPDADTD